MTTMQITSAFSFSLAEMKSVHDIVHRAQELRLTSDPMGLEWDLLVTIRRKSQDPDEILFSSDQAFSEAIRGILPRYAA